jgi:hypothetical protein
MFRSKDVIDLAIAEDMIDGLLQVNEAVKLISFAIAQPLYKSTHWPSRLT